MTLKNEKEVGGGMQISGTASELSKNFRNRKIENEQASTDSQEDVQATMKENPREVPSAVPKETQASAAPLPFQAASRPPDLTTTQAISSREVGSGNLNVTAQQQSITEEDGGADRRRNDAEMGRASSARVTTAETARVTNSPHEEGGLVQAQPVEDFAAAEAVDQNREKKRIFLAFSSVVVAAVGISLGITLLSTSGGSSTSDQPNIPTPNETTTVDNENIDGVGGTGDGSVSAPTITDREESTPTVSPTVSNNEFVVEASYCFNTTEELMSMVDIYINLQIETGGDYDLEEHNETRTNISSVYGWPIGQWCTSEITNLGLLFSSFRVGPAELRLFNEDISRWNVSRVTDINNMFASFDASAFNQPLNDWDVSNVETMAFLFTGCYGFNQPLSNWKVSRVTDFSGMFVAAYFFDQNVSTWDLSSAISMDYMFAGARSFNQDISSWNLSSVTSTFQMFEQAWAFNSSLSLWDLSRVENMASMFVDAQSFNRDVSAWDVSSVVSMAAMFRGATSFNGNLSSWDVGGVETMEQMFRGSTSFNGDVSAWDVSSVTSMNSMFRDAAVFNADVSRWVVSQVRDHLDMFRGARSFDRDISRWNTSSSTSMASMFEGATSFNVDISRWDVSSLELTSAMFRNAIQFNFDLSSWNVSRVRYFARMFLNASNFSQNLCAWGPHLLKDLSFSAPVSEMFLESGCNVTDDPLLNVTPEGPLCAPC